jgi:hypothetical protein
MPSGGRCKRISNARQSMSPQPDPNLDVRRVVLPSGKTIEVVYFGGEPRSLSETPAPAQEVVDLHVCPRCSSQLVYPVAWEEASESAWHVALRCPDCEWRHEDVYTHEMVERLDEELDRGTQTLVQGLKELTQANMAEEVDRFVAAIHADQIWPIDF